MIRIDDTLLEELGLLALPKEERDKLLRQIYETLEMRVGMRLAERMSDSQLDEFERFINGDLAFTEQYLNQYKTGWQQSEPYQKALQNAQMASQRANRPFNENAVKTEFGALTWLETNFPDYKDVVAEELEKLKAEIKKDSAQIAQAAAASQQMSPPPAQPLQAPSPMVSQPPQMPPAQAYAQQPPVQPQYPQGSEQSQPPAQPPQFPPAQAA